MEDEKELDEEENQRDTEEGKRGHGSPTASTVSSIPFERRKEIDRYIRDLMDEAGYSMYRTAPPGEDAEKINRELKTAAKRGRQFIDGPKLPRWDALSREIENIYLKLREAGKGTSAENVFEALRENRIIQEIEDGVIYWRTPEGLERSTGYKAFQNRLSRIKKKHSQP